MQMPFHSKTAVSFSVFQAFINKTFHFGSFALNARIIYQKSANKDVINLPEIATSSEVYFTKEVFGGAAIIQPGMSVYYNTAYYADKYMPALRSFYSNNNIQTGNYVIANIFFNVKIKRTRLFVSYQHINAHWTSYNYISIPHYPLHDGAFKFGLNWKFWD